MLLKYSLTPFQLKAYAMYLTTTPRVEDTYTAKAVNGDTIINYENDDMYGEFEHHIHIIRVFFAYHLCPSVLVSIVLLIIVFILFSLCFKPCETKRETLISKVLDIIKEDKLRQANAATVIAMCILATIHNCALDIASFSSSGPKYYKRITAIEIYTIIFLAFSFLCLVGAFVIFLVSLVIRIYGKYRKIDVDEHVYLGLLIATVLFTGNAVVSFSFHIPLVFIAWTTDPFYAGRIAVYYGIVIFVYFVTFKNAYTLPYVCLKWLNYETEYWACFGVLSIFVVGVFIGLIHVISVLFFVVIPIDYSITESVNGAQTLYQSAVLLVGGVITYNIAWFYFSNPFSMEKALKKTWKEMNKPQGINIPDNKWKDLSEEERMKLVLKRIIEKQCQTLAEPINHR